MLNLNKAILTAAAAVCLISSLNAQAMIRVKEVKGAVQVKNSNEERWGGLNDNALVRAEDQIRTSGGATVLIAWKKAAKIRIHENSSVTVRKAAEKEVTVLVEIGNVTVEHSGEKGKVLVVSSPSAQIYVKHRALFTMQVKENFATDVVVTEGAVVAKAADVVKPALVKKGHSISMRQGFLGKPQALKETGKKGPVGTAEAPAAAPGQEDEFAVLTLAVPLEGEVFSTPAIEVTGQYRQQGVVFVNGEKIDIDEKGAFTVIIEMLEGPQVVNVQAKSPAGETFEVKRDILVNTLPPQVDIYFPVRGNYTADRHYNLRGTVFDRTPTDKVYVLVNNRRLQLDNNGFSTVLSLAEGVNYLTVEARDRGENVVMLDTMVVLDTQVPELVLYFPRGPGMAFDEPPSTPEETPPYFAVRGRIIDPEPSSGIQSFTINGNPIPLEEDGCFDHDIMLKSGKSNRLSLRVTDMAGNEYFDDSRIIKF